MANHKGFNHYEDRAGEWRWRLVDGNYRIVADSTRGYHEKADCVKSSEVFKSLGPDAPVFNSVNDRGNGAEWEYFCNSKSDWYWHFQVRKTGTTSKENIVADGSEGYESEYNVKRAIDNVKSLLRELVKADGSQSGHTSPSTSGTSGSNRFA